MKFNKDDALGIDFTLESINDGDDMIKQIKNIKPNYDIIKIFKILSSKSNYNKNKLKESINNEAKYNKKNEIHNLLSFRKKLII